MASIGIFDSGFGGLSIFREIRQLLPDYNFIYLGDNANAPYGERSFDDVFQLTKQGVERLQQMDCPLVILACNTASAKALRNIQQRVLPYSDDPSRRVLGVVRPTVERIEQFTYSGHIGILATTATVTSQSYEMELEKITTSIRLDFKPLVVNSHACPTWVPLIEQGNHDSKELHDAVLNDMKQLLEQDPLIDAIILGCTHFPLVASVIQQVLVELHKPEIILMPQGKPVAYALRNWLRRHPEMEQRLGKEGNVAYYTTGDVERFQALAPEFIGIDTDIQVQKL